jgi:hypothetical protein
MSEREAYERARMAWGPGGRACRFCNGPGSVGCEVGYYQGGVFHRMGKGRDFDEAFSNAARDPRSERTWAG